MEKLIKKLDEIFKQYGVSQEEIEEVGNLLNNLNGELNTDGEEFVEPEGENTDGYEEDEPEFDEK